ncbi:MAG: ABC transporter permease [Candidatus Eremiobacteraeota bacterium]|nr:ABC transporter permease [Candidatus Eremiobacteraeota bacterium]
MLGPVAVLLLSVSPGNVAAELSSVSARSAAGVSFGASLVAVCIAALLGVPAGYELSRWRGGMRNVAFFVLALPLAFPPVASGILLLNVIGTRTPLGAWLSSHGIVFVDSFAGVALAEFFVSGSFVVLTSCAAFSALDPIYEESAAMLGATALQRFLRVALPIAAPNVLAGILLAWLRAIGEYGATSIVAYHPTSLPVALYVTLAADGIGPALALSYGFVLLAAVILGLQWALRRHVV